MQITDNFGENPKTFALISLNNIWVVDSRLIAQDLGIEHKNLMETIRKYQNKIESNFGTLAFETREFKTKQGNKSIEKFCYLTEDQAIFIGTLSRNTEEVVSFKIKLVQSFSDVRKQTLQTEKTAHYQFFPFEFQKFFAEIDLLKETNQKFQERIFRLETIADSRTYTIHKIAKPLETYYVYFAFNPDNNLTKIGRSYEPENRLKAFKATSPNIEIVLIINVATLKVSCELESMLHALFATKHKGGELFELLERDFKMLELLKDVMEGLM